MFVVAESMLLNEYVVDDVGLTDNVAPDPIDAPEHDAESNQFMVYGSVPPDGLAVSVEEPPLVIAMFDAVISPCACAVSIVMVFAALLPKEYAVLTPKSFAATLKVCEPNAGMFAPKVTIPSPAPNNVFDNPEFVLIRLTVKLPYGEFDVSG